MKIILIGGNEFKQADGIKEVIADLSNGVIDLLSYAGEDEGAEQTLLANEAYEPLNVTIRPHGGSELLQPPSTPGHVAYLSGGDQDKLKKTLDGSVLWQQLSTNLLANAVVLVGSSAGAMVLFEQMISYESEGSPQPKLSPGLGLIKGNKILVPHWNKYDEPWQTNFIDTYEGKLIIGLDENTALSWEYGEAQVLGLGGVVIYDELVRSDYSSGERFNIDFQIESSS